MINYTDKSRVYRQIITVNCVLNAPLMIASIAGNILILTAVLKSPTLRRSTSIMLLCSLAVSDLLVGFVVQPLYIADELISLKTENLLLHRLSGVLGFFLCGVSINTMTLISLDRMFLLLYHMRYRALITEFRIKFIIAIVWLSTLSSCSALYFWDKFVFHLITGFVISICVVICTFSYIKIYSIARRHQVQIQIEHQAVGGNSADSLDNLLMARTIKSAMNAFIFYIFLLICYVPQVVLLILFATVHKYWKPEWTFASTMIHMNSSVNPILYCWRLRELRLEVMRIGKQLLPKCRNSGQVNG
ncbi:adenosine receptor A2b-like [Montipora capricornis]|uniref:adenosine receptor A2b-like n=1 Tax=Montipora capricornis TaxID=246305 RepID=UPI0035F21066